LSISAEKMDNLFRDICALSGRAIASRRAHASHRPQHAGRRRRILSLERLEPRQLLALTHLYTFNDGLPNDWIGNAHGTLVNGAAVSAGQLVLANAGVTSGQTGLVQYMKLPAGVLPATGAFSIEVWYTTTNAADWSRVFDIGDQTGADGNSYVFFSPQSGLDDSRCVIRAPGLAEHIATGPTTDDGVQHMATIVVDPAANALRLYIDGVETSATPLDGVHAGSVNDALAYLGRSLFNADPGFTGQINELRIYDDARTADAVLVDATAGPTTANKSPQARQMEYLDRGMVAVRRSTTQAYVGWRLLGTDPASIAFNLYRSANGGAAVKLNAAPLANTTDFVDSSANFTQTNVYFVRPVINGVETAPSELFTLAANAPVRQFLSVPLQVPPGGQVPDYQNPGMTLPFTYSANDTSVGDLDGDGQYELIVKWEPSNARDNSQSGYTGNVLLDAYKLDGTRLWRIDLGRNVRAGAHYAPFLVYDFDGDGRAEVVMRTAEATVDGVGAVIGNPNADYRNSSGYILTGPETMTIFNGATGAIIHSIPLAPNRGSVASWGDSYGNRVDRFNMTVAYLDGVHPSFVLGRGYAGPQSGFSARNEVSAYDYKNGQLSVRWTFSGATNGQNPGYVGQTAHSITVGDVDGDGKDEIITGASALDDNGALLYNSGRGHGDALHLSDMDPARPGLEVFMPHENTGGNGNIGSSLRDARTGALIAGPTVVQNSEGEWPDVGRGVAADIDPNHPGYEFWNSYHGSIFDAQGAVVDNKPGNMHTNHLAWWDADLLRETVDGTTVADWNFTTGGRQNYDLDPATSGTQSAPGVSSSNGSKSNPALSGDLFGDWREEVIWRTTDSSALRIFTTTIAATSRLTTLMHDSQYRQAIAWQNSGYNQPPHPSFFLGAGMAAPPAPQIYTVSPAARIAGDFNGDAYVDALDLALWTQNAGAATVANYIAGDGDGDLDVDGHDFLAWQRNVGATPAPTAATALAPPDAPLPLVASPRLEDPAIPAAVRDEAFNRLAGAFFAKSVPRSVSHLRPQFRPAAVAQPQRVADNRDKAIAASDESAPRAPHRDADAAEPSIALALETLGELL
jgi:hypothetical protein